MKPSEPANLTTLYETNKTRTKLATRGKVHAPNNTARTDKGTKRTAGENSRCSAKPANKATDRGSRLRTYTEGAAGANITNNCPHSFIVSRDEGIVTVPFKTKLKQNKKNLETPLAVCCVSSRRARRHLFVFAKLQHLFFPISKQNRSCYCVCH